jgi:Stress responsive A/B Barrel Domain
MRKSLILLAVVALVVAGYAAFGSRNVSEAGGEKGAMLSHDVYFSLKDSSPAAKQKLVQACKKHLSGHPGEVFFAAGVRTEELSRKVNDQDFDVALHIVFKDRAAHDQYQDAPRHKDFIKENETSWSKVRVFDSTVVR